MSSLPETPRDEDPQAGHISAVPPPEENPSSGAKKPSTRQPSTARGSTPRANARPARTTASKQSAAETPAKPRTPRTPRTASPSSGASSTKSGATNESTTPATTRAQAAPKSSRTTTTRTAKPRTPAKTTQKAQPVPPPPPKPTALGIRELSKRFGGTVALDGVTIEVPEGSFYGIVGPNGAGKTTMLSIVGGLLRPDSGQVVVHDVDVWKQPDHAKRLIGVLPDRLRLFDRLTGSQLLYYSGTLRGLDGRTVKSRVNDLVEAFGLEAAAGRLVADYSAGMTKKIALAAALLHSPRVLVLDEPFESVDPVSAANITEILQKYVAAGGTVVLSSHSMDLIQRICDRVAIIVAGVVLDSGTADEVRGDKTLEERFVELAGGRKAAEGLEWLHSFAE